MAHRRLPESNRAMNSTFFFLARVAAIDRRGDVRSNNAPQDTTRWCPSSSCPAVLQLAVGLGALHLGERLSLLASATLILTLLVADLGRGQKTIAVLVALLSRALASCTSFLVSWQAAVAPISHAAAINQIERRFDIAVDDRPVIRTPCFNVAPGSTCADARRDICVSHAPLAFGASSRALAGKCASGYAPSRSVDWKMRAGPLRLAHRFVGHRGRSSWASTSRAK
jgi:hypothetical protein